jgi:formylglycine-generating enzyme required for sulfatase activity
MNKLSIQAAASRPMRLLLLCLLLLGSNPEVLANNILVSNARIVPVVGGSTTHTFVGFDLSWSNSWRDTYNWDAAWVFVKFRTPATFGGDDVWRHAWLSTDNTHHTVGDDNGTAATTYTGTTRILNGNTVATGDTSRGMGVFLYRTALGNGAINWQDIMLQWNFAEQGVDFTKPVQIQVFAVEMVVVPEGAFAAGDGVPSAGFTLTTINTATATTAPTGTGSLGGAAGGYPTSQTAPTNATWPNGFDDFALMKYEVTQQQYVDFLNTLTRTQQAARVSAVTAGRFASTGDAQTTPLNRNGVRVMTDPGGSNPRVYGCDLNNNNAAGEAADGQWIAMNFLSWMDGAAFAAWAGLRPYTELEFEKAARGWASPVLGEYAWGTTSITGAGTAAGNYSNAGTESEGVTVANANAIYSGNALLSGPGRVGMFATGSSTRQQAGASYWGIMELSGNLHEQTVTIGEVTGRGFTGLHGNGNLTTAGHANIPTWPGMTGSPLQITGSTGSGIRGYAFDSAITNLRVSDRAGAASAQVSRTAALGFRAARSEPF